MRILVIRIQGAKTKISQYFIAINQLDVVIEPKLKTEQSVKTTPFLMRLKRGEIRRTFIQFVFVEISTLQLYHNTLIFVNEILMFFCCEEVNFLFLNLITIVSPKLRL